MNESWKFWFVGIYIFISGVIVCLASLAGLPFGYVLFLAVYSYLFMGVDIYLITIDIIPFRSAWRVVIAWLPALFSDVVFGWMISKI